MDVLYNELMAGVPDGEQALRIIIRVLVATLLGAVAGFERERTGKYAGLRTHMLVSLSSAVFVLASLEAGMALDDVSRVIQGVAAGIGFIGAGAILKISQDREIQGLTTAASIWLTAAIGMAVGLGRIGLAALSMFLGLIILSVVIRVEARFHR